MRSILLGTTLCVTLFAQQPPAKQAEGEVRQTVEAFLEAVRKGDNAQVRSMLSDSVRFVGQDHTMRRTRNTLDRLAQPTPALPKGRATLIRSMQFLTPDIALVFSCWRDPAAKMPFDAGTLMLSVVRKQGVWKIETRHEAFFPSPDAYDSGPTEPIRSEGIITAEEAADGWRALFDGKTTTGWTTLGGRPLPTVWHIDDGTLHTVVDATGADIRTKERFTAFELRAEFRVAKDANSGIKYRLFSTTGAAGATAFEYQIADDNGDPGAKVDPTQRSGALYSVIAPSEQAAKPIGEWNQLRLVVAKDHIEHWLNGVKVVEAPIDAPFASPVLLQYHRSAVAYRNIKIRELPN